MQDQREIQDQEARDKIRHNLDDTLFVEAAAGTGKTTALTDRIVEVVRRGRAELKDVVAVTFTDKAAGETRLRIRHRIEEARNQESPGSHEHLRLRYALEHVELAAIGTIHSFCADLLRAHPVEAGLDPQFEVVSDHESGHLLDLAFDAWFDEVRVDPPPGVRRLLRRTYRYYSGGPRADLRNAAARLVEQRDMNTPWKGVRWDRRADLDKAISRARALAKLGGKAHSQKSWLTRNMVNVGKRLKNLDSRETLLGRRSYGYAEAWLRDLVQKKVGWTWFGYRKGKFASGVSNDDARALRDEVKADLDRAVKLADADLACRLQSELEPVVDAYESLKRARGCADFMDLLLLTRNLLRDHESIRRHYQKRYSHLFVDEFQDTDPLQVEILMLLSNEDPSETELDGLRPVPGKLFIVGDPKQSIYQFRRADVGLYEKTKKLMEEAGAEVVRLTTSFRSQRRLQKAVNQAFGPRMTGDAEAGQAEYVPLVCHRPDIEQQPALIALPVPRPYSSWGNITEWSIDESLPTAAAAFAGWLLRESNWRVTERGSGEPVPITERHICFLFRRFRAGGRDVTERWVRALEAQGIPHVLVGGSSFYNREEVIAVRNALKAIENPGDRLSVYATLRGPFFASSDTSLLHFGAEVGPLHPLARSSRARENGDDLPPELTDIAGALDILANLHWGRNRRPVSETLRSLLKAVRAHAGIAVWPNGEQALANILHLADESREFECAGADSFRAFVDHLDAQAEAGEAREAPIVEEKSGGVRLMTVHKAKGLEFPVVLLADMTCPATFHLPSRYVDQKEGLWAQRLCGSAPLDLVENQPLAKLQEAAEADRLAYVAATRARDLLIVPTLGDGRDGKGEPLARDNQSEWWLDTLIPVVYPESSAAGNPESPRKYGVPVEGSDTVLERPNRDGGTNPQPVNSVRPGLHKAQEGGDVLWWDPQTLDLEADVRTGGSGGSADYDRPNEFEGASGVEKYHEWEREREAAIESGSAKTRSVVTVKALAKMEPAPAADVLWIEIPRPPDETGRGDRNDGESDSEAGARLGRLVHDILERVALTADRDEVEKMASLLALAVGCTAQQVELGTELALRILRHEILDRARAALAGGGQLLREVPVSFRQDPVVSRQETEVGEPPEQATPSDTIVEGVADLAFLEQNGGWVVVDFKTDLDPQSARSEYASQVARYVEAFRRTTGKPVVGVVLVV